MKSNSYTLPLFVGLAMAMPIMSSASALDYSALTKAIEEQKPAFDPILSETYNVEWTSQSTESSQSMPVGGHDVGLNVWVEANSLYFYISKSDAMDENNVFGKLGRVKIDLKPNPFDESTSFSQKLVLKDGNCVIKAKGKDGNEVSITIWVDVFKPVIHVAIESNKSVTTTAQYQTWRFEETKIPMLGGFRESNDYGAYAYHPIFSQPYVLYPDVTEAEGKQISFYHKNNNADLTMNKAIDALEMRETIDLTKWHDPATDFTFGGLMQGDKMSAQTEVESGTYMHRDYKGYSLISDAPTKSQHITIALQTGQYKTADDWKKAASETLDSVKADEDLAKSVAWWHKIWKRSHIMINADTPGAPGHDVARNYQLFRYMLACNAHGVHPSKFNGGMFTWDTVMDMNGELFGSPDYRQWGPGLTLQNQRHMHWPMLRSGDYDMQAPMFNYFSDTFENTEQLVKRAYGHEGAMYSEYFNFYGLPSMGNEYWTDPRKQPDGSDVELGAMGAPLVRYEHVHQLDFSFMMLEQQRYSGRDISKYIPFIESSLTFYLEHYKFRYKKYTKEFEGSGKEDADGLDANGHLVIYPSTAVETYKNVLNPSDVIVALQCVLENMIRINKEEPERYKDIQVAKWESMLKMLPPMNLGTNVNGDPIFVPGYDPGEMGEKSPYYKSGSHTPPYNIENPQLSIVFPFNKVSQGRPGEQRALNTCETEFKAFNGGMKSHMSWSYYNLIVTRLGLVQDAEMYANLKLGNGGYRFPSFWGPGHDFSPDHNWGGTGLYGLQEMALQSYDDVISPFATWPDSWKGSFKLHAPEETIVEGFEMKDGRKVAIISLDKDSKRSSIAMQAPKALGSTVLSAAGKVKLTLDPKSKTLSFDSKPGMTYYLVQAKDEDITLEAERSSQDAVKLKWTSQAGAKSYDIYRESTGENSVLVKIANDIKGNSYTDTKSAMAQGPYSYYVVGQDEYGTGKVSNAAADREAKPKADLRDTPLANKGCVLYIKGMKDGVIKDTSGINTPIQINGQVEEAEGIFGKNDTAIRFGGGSYDYILIPPFKEDLKQTSIELWLKPGLTNKGECFFDARYSDTNNSFIGVSLDTFDRDKIRATGGADTTFFDMLTDGHMLVEGQWNHYKLNIDSKSGKVQAYLNGQGPFVRDLEAGTPIKVGPGKTLIGGGKTYGAVHYKGLMDEIKIQHSDKGFALPQSALLQVKGKQFRVTVLLSDGSKVEMTPLAKLTDQDGNPVECTQEGTFTTNGQVKSLQATLWYDGVELKTKAVKAK